MTTNEIVQFINCRLVKDHQLKTEDLYVRNGKIINPEPVFFEEKILSHKRVDCKNAIIAAGYIDIQINGGYGVDFSSEVDTIEHDVNVVAKELVKSGVTSFCPTIVTSPESTYRKVLPNIPQITEGANVLGVHLEGPFINPLKRGAHPENHIKPLENGFETLQSTYGTLDNVKIITLAPEIDKNMEVTKQLTSMGITVSLGHSMGSLADGERAVHNGARLITHLFNAMLPFHHRDPGLVGLLASNVIDPNEVVYYGIICDGVHTHPAALRIAQRTHPKGLCLVTDGISAMGLQAGVHHIGQMHLEIKDNKAFIAGTNTLCGSICTMDKCVRLFKEATDCSIVFAIEAATLHPAQCLKLERRKGTLNFGSDADFIILDDDLNVLSTWIAGFCLFKR